MSQSDPELKKYRGTAGSEVKTADISSDEHALKGVIGSGDEAQERIYDATLAGERFVNFYDDSAAAIREALSNAETACIRRAKEELRECGFSNDDIPNSVTEILSKAKEEADYEPLIEVTYNRKPDATRLIIEDNGIGISTEEYQVVQRVGYSTSHMDGDVGGQFGLGWLSLFQLTGVNGVFTMKTRSFLTDEAYGTAEYVANFEYLDAEPDEYGTRFEFPGFSSDAKSIDIPAKVEEYAEGMTVPVLYRDFDESGNETSRSDDFLPRDMASDYPDDALVVTYENEFFRAVMSPDAPENRRNNVTYNVSMPIRRNCDSFGRRPKFNARWKWDFRAKKEDGPIVFCESDDSVVGLVPKEDSKYERLMDEMQDKCIPLSEVPDDAIVMPKPASSRDSFMSGHDDFWKHVAEKLNESWGEIAKTRFEELGSVDDFEDLDTSQKKAVFRAYSHFGPSTTGNEPDNIQETLKDKLGVTVPKDVCKYVDRSRKTVNVVRRGANRAHTKGACNSSSIWKVIDNAPDGVYMGKTISQKKAEIAWGLGDTHVVRVDDTDKYSQFEKDWGWKKLKDLPARNLKEKLPELDDDVAEKFENTKADDSNNKRKSTGGNGKDPKTYRLKARVGTNSRKYYSTWKVDDIEQKLQNDDMFSTGRYSCQYLVILKEGDWSASSAASQNASRRHDIAVARLPKYAYNYLEGKKNVYTSKQAVIDDNAGCDIEMTDGTTVGILDTNDDDMLFTTSSKTKNHFEDDPERLAELLNYDPDNFERFAFVSRNELDSLWGQSVPATVVKTSNGSTPTGFKDYSYHRTGHKELKRKDMLSGLDKSNEAYSMLFEGRRKKSGSALKKKIELYKAATTAGETFE